MSVCQMDDSPWCDSETCPQCDAARPDPTWWERVNADLRVKRPQPVNSTDVERAMQDLAEAIGARIGANGINDPGAAFDAWQLALQQLRMLRGGVQRAVEAEAGK